MIRTTHNKKNPTNSGATCKMCMVMTKKTERRIRETNERKNYFLLIEKDGYSKSKTDTYSLLVLSFCSVS